MNQSLKFGIAAVVVFLLPGLLIPAFIHEQEAMRRAVYLAYVFCCPVAAVIASLNRKRNVVFYLGIASLLTPIEILFGLAYQASFLHHVDAAGHMASGPSRDQVAQFYLPVFFLTTMVVLPLGLALTYKGTRKGL